MADNPKREIMLAPEYSILMDGLGYSVLVLGGVPGKDEEGREIVTFTIYPDEKVRKRYDFRMDRELDPSTGKMELKILKVDLIPLNIYDDANKKWLYVKTFLHEETELSTREDKLKMQLREATNKLDIMDAQILWLNEQLEMALNNPQKIIQQGIEVSKEAMRVASEFIKKGDKES